LCLLLSGRIPATSKIGLTELGVEMDESGFIVGNHGGDAERTSVPNIYAIGDILKVSISTLQIHMYFLHILNSCYILTSSSSF